MSGKKSKRAHNRGIFRNYIIYILVFTVIGLVLAACVLLVANKPVTELVHKIEERFPPYVRDISADIAQDSREKEYIGSYGDRIGSIVIDECGLNCDIYCGNNRASMRIGAGFSGDETDLVSGDGVKLISGYDETYFSSLKYAETGDIIKVNGGDSSAEYKVFRTAYIGKDKDPYSSDKADVLILRSVPSEFSDHAGEYFYVFAERISGEDG